MADTSPDQNGTNKVYWGVSGAYLPASFSGFGYVVSVSRKESLEIEDEVLDDNGVPVTQITGAPKTEWTVECLLKQSPSLPDVGAVAQVVTGEKGIITSVDLVYGNKEKGKVTLTITRKKAVAYT
jgi:hypothetical protein